MVLEQTLNKYIPRDNDFYREHYHQILLGLIAVIFLMILVLGVCFYQIMTRPLPQFHAVQPDGKSMLLIPSEEPNLLPSTVLRWASKGATLAYNFDFVAFKQQAEAARPYFTKDGWNDYQQSVSGLLNTIVQNKLIVYGVVSGTPVISNQGPLAGKGDVWRIQIPFLVTYMSENTTTKQNYFVILSIVRVPTRVNKQGIGIDQFVMV